MSNDHFFIGYVSAENKEEVKGDSLVGRRGVMKEYSLEDSLNEKVSNVLTDGRGFCEQDCVGGKIKINQPLISLFFDRCFRLFIASASTSEKEQKEEGDDDDAISFVGISIHEKG
jgi:hypothetical protein